MQARFRIIITIVSFTLFGCNNEQPTPLQLANKVVQEYEKHQNISYDIDYQIKFFSGTDDTNKVAAKIDLIRLPEDSVMGGIIWIEGDSIARYYDENNSYLIRHSQKKMMRYPRDKPFIFTGHIVGEAIRIYFLKPDRLINGANNDSTTSIDLKQESLNTKEVWKWTYRFKDDGEYTNSSKEIWFDKKDFTIPKMTYTSTFQNENQYNQWEIKNIEFDKVTKEDLSSRLEKLIETYEIEDYKEMTAEERAPLANGTIMPELKGVLYPSNDSTSFKKLKGRVSIIDFWYMNCAPCIDAIPHLNELHEKYAEQGLVVIGVNPHDNTEKSLKRFPNFLENNKISYPILFSERSEMKKFKVQGYPTLYLVDEEGEILFSQIGFGEELPTAIDSLIKVNLDIQ